MILATRRQFRRGINLDGVVGRLHDFDPVAVFKGPQLFKGLQPLQVSFFELGKFLQKGMAIGINAVMLIVRGNVARIPDIGYRRPGKNRAQNDPYQKQPSPHWDA